MRQQDDEFEEFATFIPAEPRSMSPLCINVEFMELYDRVGEEEIWVVLGKLKDLLG